MGPILLGRWPQCAQCANKGRPRRVAGGVSMCCQVASRLLPVPLTSPKQGHRSLGKSFLCRCRTHIRLAVCRTFVRHKKQVSYACRTSAMQHAPAQTPVPHAPALQIARSQGFSPQQCTSPRATVDCHFKGSPIIGGASAHRPQTACGLPVRMAIPVALCQNWSSHSANTVLSLGFAEHL